MNKQTPTKAELLRRVSDLEQHLQEAESTIEALRRDAAGAPPDASARKMAADLSASQQAQEHSQQLAEELGAANEELQVQAEELRVQAEEMLTQNEELERLSQDLETERALLRTVLEQMPGGVIVAEAPFGKLLLANQQLADILGHPVPMAGSLENYSHFRGLHPDGRPYEPRDNPLARCLIGGEKLFEEEVSIIRGDGSPGVIQVSAAPVRHANGEIIAAVATYRDLTARKQREREILRQASFPQVNPSPVLEADTAGRITYFNQAARETIEKLGGAAAISDFLPADFDEIVATARMTGEKHFRREVQVAHAYFLVTVSYVENFNTMRIYAIDITQRKRAEEALIRAKQEWERTFDAVPDLIAILDNDHRILRSNRAMAQALGKEPQDLVGQICYEVVHRTPCPPDLCPHSRLLQDGRRHAAELRELDLDLLVTVSPLRDDQGRLLGSVHVARDITERKQAEEALRRSEEHYRSLFDNMLNGYAYCQMHFEDGRPVDFTYLTVNSAFEHLTGLKNVAGKCVSEVIPGIGESNPELLEIYGRVASTGMPERFETYVEPLKMWFEISVYCPQKEYFVAIFYVITARKHSEAALKDSEERFRTMANALPQLAWIAKSDGYIFWYNQRWYDYTGTTPEEMEGWGWQSVHDTKTLPKVLDQWRSSIATGNPFDMVFPLRGSDGQFRQFLTRVMPIKDADGQVLQWFGTNTDITERQQAEKALQKAHDELEQRVAERTTELRQTVEVLQEEIAERQQAERQTEILGRLYWVLSRVNETIVRATDRETLFQEACRIAVNEGGFRLAWVGLSDPVAGALKVAAHYGHDEGYLESLLIPLEDVPESRGPTGVAARENRFDICNDFVAEPRMAPWRERALSRGYLSSGAFPLRLGSEVVGVITIYSDQPNFFNQEEIGLLESLAGDLSFALEAMDREERRRQAEAEIQKLNEELEARVQERTAQLEAANREMEAFSYSVSHDLKAPIRAIDGFSRMLMLEHAAQLDAEARRLLEVIRQNTDFMARLIDDLLALSRLGRHELRKAWMDLAAMSANAFRELKAQAPGRHLDLTIKELPPAFGDPSLLNQVLVNLLANACKYTKFEETASIEMGGWRAPGENVYYVKDNGVGFDMRFENKLFGVFQRLHGGKDFEGTGVGLAIVQRILQRHSGRVWAEGKVGEGATFFFALPMAEE